MTEEARETGRGIGGMSPRAAAWLAWSLCALTPLSITCAVALAMLNSTDVFSLFYLVAVALCALVGGVVATRRSANPVGWILLGVGAILAFQEFALQYATFGLLTDPGSLPLARATAWLISWLYAPGMLLLLSFLPLYFPDGHLISVRWRWIARFVLVVAVVGAASGWDQGRVVWFVEANLERFSREALKNATTYLPPEVAERFLQAYLTNTTRGLRRTFQ